MVQRIKVTRQNVMPDRLCFEVNDTDAGGVVERIFDWNFGLGAQMRKQKHVLELGQELLLPEVSDAPQVIEQVTLWN